MRHRPLGGRIVTGDKDIELLAADLTGHERAGKGGVECLHDRCSLWYELLNLLGGGLPWWCRQPVPCLGVDRVGDVHDDLAGELIGVLLDGILDARVVNGEDDHPAAEPCSRFKRGGGAAELGGELLRLRRVAVDDLDLSRTSTRPPRRNGGFALGRAYPRDQQGQPGDKRIRAAHEGGETPMRWL